MIPPHQTFKVDDGRGWLIGHVEQTEDGRWLPTVRGDPVAPACARPADADAAVRAEVLRQAPRQRPRD